MAAKVVIVSGGVKEMVALLDDIKEELLRAQAIDENFVESNTYLRNSRADDVDSARQIELRFTTDGVEPDEVEVMIEVHL